MPSHDFCRSSTIHNISPRELDVLFIYSSSQEQMEAVFFVFAANFEWRYLSWLLDIVRLMYGFVCALLDHEKLIWST